MSSRSNSPTARVPGRIGRDLRAVGVALLAVAALRAGWPLPMAGPS